MTTATAPERHFVTYSRGEIREDILASWRVHLRNLTNPDTKLPFTETEIATATASHSRYWIEADAIDLALLGHQSNSRFLADQVAVQKASTAWLENFHGPQWGAPRLGAVGGSGTVTERATAGTVAVGSTTIPDPAAFVLTAPDGKRFQNLYNATATLTGANGTEGFTLTLKAIDTGEETNVVASTKFTPAENIPPGVTEDAVAFDNFSGGVGAETDAEWAQRIADTIRHKPASGNNSHIRTFARRALASVEDAFVYACALNQGTVIVCPVQKRGAAAGPYARIASTSTIETVTNYLVPPGSPVMPHPPFILVVPADDTPTSVVAALSMPSGRDAGWADAVAWPEVSGSSNMVIDNLVSQTAFQVIRPSGTADLPTGVTAPSLMSWDIVSSRFYSLEVQSVTPAGGDVFDVVLSAAPPVTLENGTVISPDTELRDTIAEAIEAYYDSLGPGEVIDLTSDNRAHRAYRFPPPEERWPQEAGSGVLTYLHDALGAVLSNATLEYLNPSEPPLPSTPSLGPRQLTLLTVGLGPQ